VSALAAPRRTPRYGSAAELAAYAGLSVKTVRRLVDAGKVAGHKVGRRVLIPFEDFDRLISQPGTKEARPMSIAPSTTSPHRSVDARGRALPMTDAEVRARAKVAIRALDALDDIGDEAEQLQTLEALIEAIDSEPLSDRKRFG
jgi:excisionase family DNA binding protein